MEKTLTKEEVANKINVRIKGFVIFQVIAFIINILLITIWIVATLTNGKAIDPFDFFYWQIILVLILIIVHSVSIVINEKQEQITGKKNKILKNLTKLNMVLDVAFMIILIGILIYAAYAFRNWYN